MEYESIPNAADITKAALRQGALAADLELLAAQAELDGRQAMLASNKPDARIPDAQGNPTGPTLGEFIAAQEAEVDRLTRRAKRKAKRAKDAGEEVPAAELKAARVAWITDVQIRQLEQEHLTHSFLLAERESALAVTGVNAATPADRARLEALVAENKASLATINRLHAAAKTRRTGLTG